MRNTFLTRKGKGEKGKKKKTLNAYGKGNNWQLLISRHISLVAEKIEGIIQDVKIFKELAGVG